MVKSVSSDAIKKIARSGPESQVSWKSIAINSGSISDGSTRFIGCKAIYLQLRKKWFCACFALASSLFHIWVGNGNQSKWTCLLDQPIGATRRPIVFWPHATVFPRFSLVITFYFVRWLIGWLCESRLLWLVRNDNRNLRVLKPRFRGKWKKFGCYSETLFGLRTFAP